MKRLYTSLHLLGAACGILALSLPAAAETHPARVDSTATVEVLNQNKLPSRQVYEKFAEVSPAAFNVPAAPRFAFVGKDNKFYVGLGATIKATVSYDFGDPITNPNEFTTSAINMNPKKGNGGLVQFSGQQSSVYLNFVALPDDPNQIGIYIQGNFLGAGYGFQLQFAYAKYRGITAGYDYSLFTDVAAAPPTIDYEGPNALTAIPNVVLDYRHSFGKFSFGVGAELPQASYTTSAGTESVNQRVPDIPAYVQYDFGSNSRLRFSAILRNMTYRDLVADKNRTATGYGIKLSGYAAITPSLTAYYQAAYGRGMTSYFQDLNGCGLDLTPEAGESGHLKPVEAWGAYGGLQYTFSPKFYASATYSHVRTYADRYNGGATAWGDQYRYAQYVVGNVFYNINSIVSVGLEYIYGRRVDYSGLSHHDNRLQAAIMVTL